MKWLPWLRAYQCANCGKVQLLRENSVTAAKAFHAARAAIRPKAATPKR